MIKQCTIYCNVLWQRRTGLIQQDCSVIGIHPLKLSRHVDTSIRDQISWWPVKAVAVSFRAGTVLQTISSPFSFRTGWNKKNWKCSERIEEAITRNTAHLEKFFKYSFYFKQCSSKLSSTKSTLNIRPTSKILSCEYCLKGF